MDSVVRHARDTPDVSTNKINTVGTAFSWTQIVVEIRSTYRDGTTKWLYVDKKVGATSLGGVL